MTGENKKLNYPVTKAIRLTGSQAKKWNPEEIRDFLDGNVSNGKDTQILKKLIFPFAKAGIKVDLEKDEIARIQQLMEEIQ